MSYHQQALAKARQYNLPEYEARALLNVAALYSDHNPVIAKNLLEGLEIAKEINDVSTTAKLTNSLGVVEGKKGNLKEATRYFLKALKLYQSVKDTLGIVQTYIKLGVVNEMNE